MTVDVDVRWIRGQRSPRRSTDPPIQVHFLDSSTIALRQSKSVHYEAPFMYLLLGSARALLLDTGATKDPSGFPLRRTVDGLMEEWRRRHRGAVREPYELVVAYSHPHSDHVAGDGQFDGRSDTVVVGRDQQSVADFFSIARWPHGTGSLELGGRTVTVLATPGHHRAAITLYDPPTQLLFTGDTVYPGRLYVEDSAAFVASLERLVAFEQSRRVSYVLGGHIEMTRTAGRDYPIGTRCQPDEPSLAMTTGQLRAVCAAAQAVRARPGAHQFDDFAIWIGPCVPARLLHLGRLGLQTVRTSGR